MLSVVAVLVSILAVADDPKPSDRVAIAKAFLDALIKEDFEAAAKDYDDAVRKASPPEKTKEFWNQLKKQVGALKKQGTPRTEKRQEYTAVIFACEFEKITLDLTVNIDKNGKIAGYFLRPPTKAYRFDPPKYAKPDRFTEKAVVVGEGEWKLPGTLTMPKGDGPFPGVVLVHGSGPNDRDETIGPNKPFRDLAWGLATNGVAVLRYEKRTREHGPKFIKLKDEVTLKEEVFDDALLAAELLRKQKGVNPKRVFIVGHSLGAMAAPRLAELDKQVAGAAILAAPTRPLEDVVVEQFTYLFSLKGELSEEDKDYLEKLKKKAAKVKDPKLSSETPGTELPLDQSAKYWLSLRNYDIPGTAAKLTVPLFIGQGERDYQVTMEDFAGWKKKLGDRKNVTYKNYPNLNHLFMDGKGKAKPQEYEKPGHVAEELITDLVAWIKATE